ncbi:MAG: BTAD domain-containing putative transcriptional regulator [Acidiferrobacterales bacterium]
MTALKSKVPTIGGKVAVMAQPTISLAKTTRPSLTTVLRRERLFALLDQGNERSITWVVGPPGSGKTTLVSNYLEVRKVDHLWYQVDQDDSDVATFFYYMGQAAAKHGKDDRKPLPVMSAEYSGDVVAFARGYFRELYNGLKKPFALVFDNCQEAPLQSKFHEVLVAGLAEIPKGGCVIIISRVDPPSNMARFRANQKMQVIGWNDLRLTSEELEGIARVRGERIPEETLEQVYDKTQGWAAGAVLMLEHTKMIGTVAEPPTSFTPQVIFDYLAGEIFEKFEPETQQFLLRSACVPRMTASAAKQLSEHHQADGLLLNLARNDYFVTESQAPGEPVYQFHPLFREFLLARAQETYPDDERAELRRKAAVLLEQYGQVDDAVALLLESGDWEQVVPMILSYASEMLDQGRGETLAGWLDDLPLKVLQGNPWLVYWQGAGRFHSAPREGRRLFEQAYQLFESQDDKDHRGLILACCGVIDSVLHEFDDLSLLDRWRQTLETLWKTYTDASARDVETHVTRSVFMCLVLRTLNHPEFEHWLERAQAVSQSSDDPKLRMLIEPLVATHSMWGGDYSRARDTIDSLRSLAQSSDVSSLALANLKYVEAMYHMLVGEHDACRRAVEQGLEISRSHGVQVWGDQLLALGVAVHLEIGDLEASERLLKEMESGLARSRRLGRCLYHSLSAWRALLQDDPVSAYQHQRIALTTSLEVGSPFYEVLCRLGWAQVLAANGEERKGQAQLRRVNGILNNMNSRLLEFMMHLTSAEVALQGGRHDAELKELRVAMELGREHGFTHVLWWRPKVMAQLCAHALAEGIEEEYVLHLIRARRLSPVGESSGVVAWPWPFKLFTLGKFRLLKDDQLQTFAGKTQSRPLELLKVLIALGGKEVRAEQLAETLWPHVDGDYAHASFTSTLHRLRRLLGVDESVILQDGRVTLNPSYFWVDTWAFDQLLARLDAELTEAPKPIKESQPSLLADQLLQLYQGPFLEDESDRACYIAFREHSRSKFLRYMNKLSRCWEESEQLEKVADYYERGIEADSLCEGLYRQLMTFYQKQGRSPEALEVYDRCRKTFSALLRANPSPETTAIYESIRGS